MLLRKFIIIGTDHLSDVMSIEKLRRVMLRVRAKHPGKNWIRRDDLWRAIAVECGTSRMTYFENKKALVKLGWLKQRKSNFRLTGNDLTEDF